jgi:hypothetical protein
MATQLSVPLIAPVLEADRKRPALAVERKPARPIRRLPVIGELFELPREEIRSKRVKVSAPRMLRAGDRPQSLGATRVSREARRDTEVDEWQYGVKFGPPAEFGRCPPKGPCGHASCRYSLLIEVGESKNGKPPSVKLNHPGADIETLRETCSLRVAEAADQRRTTKRSFGEPVMSCEEVAELLNLTPERVRQLEAEAKAKLLDRLAHLRDR